MMADETENQTEESVSGSQTTGAGTGGPSKVTAENLRVLENVEVQMTVEVGNTEIKIRDFLVPPWSSSSWDNSFGCFSGLTSGRGA